MGTKVWPNLPTNLTNSTDATWEISADGDDAQIEFTATPVETDYAWTVVTLVTPGDIVSSVEAN
ncbi:MAG: hypothetical protein M5T52_18075 [Ignavibacteriaceae bacterium]|nr:hypothetical protein [Ignavibacteriaceae bacterium]